MKDTAELYAQSQLSLIDALADDARAHSEYITSCVRHALTIIARNARVPELTVELTTLNIEGMERLTVASTSHAIDAFPIERANLILSLVDARAVERREWTVCETGEHADEVDAYEEKASRSADMHTAHHNLIRVSHSHAALGMYMLFADANLKIRFTPTHPMSAKVKSVAVVNSDGETVVGSSDYERNLISTALTLAQTSMPVGLSASLRGHAGVISAPLYILCEEISEKPTSSQ